MKRIIVCLFFVAFLFGCSDNNPPTDRPIITGIATNGNTLTADTTTMADNLVFSYQWHATNVPISNAIEKTYTLTLNEIGKTITVKVSWVNANNTSESRFSKATTVVVRLKAKEDFIDYAFLQKQALSLATKYPHIFSAKIIGKSIENRDIIAFKINSQVNSDAAQKAKIVLVGTYHAREWIVPNVVHLIAQQLLEDYGANSEITALIDNSEIWIVPMVNPDGHEYSRIDDSTRYWRKNRRDNGDGTYGVDLNRNHSFKWGYDDIGSSPTTSSNTYRGAAPASEPETKAIEDFVTEIHPQIFVSYHSYSQLVLYPWGYINDLSKDNAQLSAIATKISEAIKAVHGEIYKPVKTPELLYNTNGDAIDWSYGALDILSFLIELRPSEWLSAGFNGFSPHKDEILPTFEENYNAIKYLLSEAQNIKNSPVKPLKLLKQH
ncbi:hypothetical protein [uncultured Gammaproteobacteria bacterium]|jgi:murein tripeptide amidase MpaA|nr:hypothetical protein [uncultured Gammaproteobacteria bacterium]CAC9956987.1 hypothetical protein [uncultured Gammaproteobacteria bacterium]